MVYHLLSSWRRLVIEDLCIHRDTQRYIQTGSYRDRLRSGRLKAMSKSEKWFIVITSKRNRRLLHRKFVSRSTNITLNPVSLTTLKRHLRNAVNCCDKTPSAVSKLRLQWALSHWDWIADPFKKCFGQVDS